MAHIQRKQTLILKKSSKRCSTSPTNEYPGQQVLSGSHIFYGNRNQSLHRYSTEYNNSSKSNIQENIYSNDNNLNNSNEVVIPGFFLSKRQSPISNSSRRIHGVTPPKYSRVFVNYNLSYPGPPNDYQSQFLQISPCKMYKGTQCQGLMNNKNIESSSDIDNFCSDIYQDKVISKNTDQQNNKKYTPSIQMNISSAPTSPTKINSFQLIKRGILPSLKIRYSKRNFEDSLNFEQQIKIPHFTNSILVNSHEFDLSSTKTINKFYKDPFISKQYPQNGYINPSNANEKLKRNSSSEQNQGFNKKTSFETKRGQTLDDRKAEMFVKNSINNSVDHLQKLINQRVQQQPLFIDIPSSIDTVVQKNQVQTLETRENYFSGPSLETDKSGRQTTQNFTGFCGKNILKKYHIIKNVCDISSIINKQQKAKQSIKNVEKQS